MKRVFPSLILAAFPAAVRAQSVKAVVPVAPVLPVQAPLLPAAMGALSLPQATGGSCSIPVVPGALMAPGALPATPAPRLAVLAVPSPSPSQAPGALPGDSAPESAAAKVQPFKQWQCLICGFIYDEEKGLPEEGLSPGTRWADIPADWRCPECGEGKSSFDMVELK